MKKIIVSLICVPIILCGCTEITPQSPSSLVTTTLRTASLPTTPLMITVLPPASFTAQAEYNVEPKTVGEWRSGGEEIVINGGYFHEDYTPSGYLVVDKKRVGKRIFDQDKSGIFFSKDKTVSVRDLKTDPIKTGEEFDFAVQSFPFLIEDGKPAITTKSQKRARRTAVGIDQEQNLYIIIVDQKELSLYEFMEELIKTNIPFVHVLNLDGGPSTGIYKRWNNEELLKNSYFPVPNVVRIKKK